MKGEEEGKKGNELLEKVVISHAPEETLTVGRIIGGLLQAGDAVGLTGDLGSGKTCLTKGIAAGLGVSDRYEITSPTFTLINEYPGRIPFYHIDVYRLTGIQDLESIGFEDYFYARGVVVIEWVDRIKEAMTDLSLLAVLTYEDVSTRKIKLTGRKEKVDKIFNELQSGGF